MRQLQSSGSSVPLSGHGDKRLDNSLVLRVMCQVLLFVGIGPQVIECRIAVFEPFVHEKDKFPLLGSDHDTATATLPQLVIDVFAVVVSLKQAFRQESTFACIKGTRL